MTDRQTDRILLAIPRLHYMQRGKKSSKCKITNLYVFSELEPTFTFAICRRPSVCLSVCRLSVTFVHPTRAIAVFGNVSTPFGSLAICDLSIKILRRSSQGNPSGGG